MTGLIAGRIEHIDLNSRQTLAENDALVQISADPAYPVNIQSCSLAM